MLTPDDAGARSQRRRPRSLRRLTSFFRRKSPDATAGADQTGARSTIPNAVSSSAPAPVVHRSCPGDPPATLVDDSPALVSDDIWSAAFRQAVASFQQETGTAIPEGQSLAHMFGALEGLDSNATHEDAIKQGVEKLRAIQGPLENFKMVLDLASPLTSLEPITMTVFGVVRSVTMIGIGIANADVDFAKQIKDMLRRLQCINDCDTLGQKTNRSHIHETLVLVYREILTFYTVVLDILTTKGIKLWVKLAQELQDQRVPEIVQEISHLTENLHDAIQLAISGLVVNINDRLTSMEIDRLFDTEELRLQESYRKELQDSRRKGGSGTNRTSRGDQACQFMLTDATFLDWLSNFSETANLFAIIGHMGSGKSVLVSFLIEELKRRNRGQIPEPKVCNYYCRDARPGLENRVYSVLLFQLLEQLPWLKEPFLKWYKKEVESGNHPLEDASILEDYLDALCGLLERPLFLVIDGVDECDPDTCRSIITLLRRLSKGNLNVKILLSCRPSQEIVKQLELMLQVHLVASDERDRLIVEHTVHKRLESLSDEVKNEIVRAVSSAAQGSAIWTRMTIESIVKEEITQLRPILSFLQNMSLPGGLADLYKNLLPPATDAVGSRKRKTATVALMILYAARRPLSISELGWATALGTAPQDTTAVSALAVLVDAPRILRLIRPFLAPIDFDDLTKRQIFLVHKSVEEFVLEIVKPPHQHPEKCIFDICVRYLLLDEIGHFHLFSEEQILSSELRQATDLFADSLSGTQEYNEDCDWDEWEADETRFDPTESRAGAEHGFGHFFVYASCHWVDHLGALDLEDLARTDDIERLCHVGSTRLRNWIEQHRRPDCVLQPRFTFDYSLYDPLSIVALFGSDAVFADMLATSDFKSSSYSAETIENAAAQLRQWGGKTQVTRSRGRVQARQFGSQGRIAALEDAVLRQAS